MRTYARMSNRPALPVGLALALAFVAGAALSAQAYVNGQLGARLDAPAMAAFMSQAIGFTALVAIGLAGGALPRALARARAGRRPRAWHLLACAQAALLVGVSTIAAPKVGVALLTVALVSGQTLGSLGADALALSPAGHGPVTPRRAAGVALAIGAVALGALGADGGSDPLLLGLAVLGGAGLALTQAAIGQIAEATGEPVAAAAISFITAAGPLLALVLALHAFPSDWSVPPQLWLGGLLGPIVALVLAVAVGTLGVLQLTLALVAGQAVGGVVADLLAPAAQGAVTAQTLASVALTFAAVATASAFERGVPRSID
jgi:bacterial/archaeal transporter family-2 protein